MNSLPGTFVVGANLPWINYGLDFGANAWQHDGGIARPENRARLDAAFHQLSTADIHYVRWFLLCDGRAGIEYDAEGRPVGPDSRLFRDLDAALAVAQRHGISVMFVLLDFLWCARPTALGGVQMGGRASLLKRDGCAALLDNVVRPLVERYGKEPSIFAWDIFNEPEWILTLTQGELRSFLVDAIALVRSCARQPITIGSAGLRWRRRYDGLELDFHQVHWYETLARQPPLHTPVDQLGYDRPVVLGEFPTNGSLPPDRIVEMARAAGYAGAFFWSLLASDECTEPATFLRAP